jgi:HAE1 family hydrophobic/amphiphilic exporter-1
MGFQGMTLNFMTLGGLAIAIGRVVDDSIVVLENIYRHLQRDEERWRVALDATREVAPAITASTLTTIAVFVPLGFIQGLVGSFFLPFAMTVSFCLLASLLVSLTAVPVLGAIFLRPGDLSDEAITGNDVTIPNNWIHRLYTPSLLWALRHRAATLITAFSLVIASLGLTFFIPVTLFPSDGNQFLTVQMSLPVGTSIDRTFAEVDMVEAELADLSTRGLVEIYNTTVGAPSETFGRGTQLTGGFNEANIFIRLAKNAPNNLEKDLRDKFPSNDQRIVTVTALQDGPPSAGVEIMITGSDYPSVSSVTKQLSEEIRGIDGIVNLFTEVATARDEIVINVDPGSAIALGLSARNVALQVNQYLVGQTVAQMNLEGTPTDIILRGRADTVNDIDAVRNLSIVGRAGSAMLGNIANVSFQKGPVSISRTNGVRSASIRGLITDKDTQAIGRNIQDRIDALILPLGVEITTGGIFNQIAEGFQDIFLAMAIGIALVYLVMVASLGSLRNPFIIVMSLPLALIGALVALLITGRTLGLPAMMGILILVGLVVTNAIVLIAFVEQLRERGASLQDALVQGGKVRLRPILMTAFTTSFALIPLAAFGGDEGGIIGAELATVVIGGLASSTFLTLIVVPVIYIIMHQSIPKLFERVLHKGNARAL